LASPTQERNESFRQDLSITWALDQPAHTGSDDKLECSRATVTRCIEELRNYLNAPLDYDRQRRSYFYNQQSPDKLYKLPSLWFSAEELNGLLICHQILQNISPGILSRQITQLQQRIDDLFKIQHQTPVNISQNIKLRFIGRRLKDDAQFKKTTTALFSGKQINIHYNGRGENATNRANHLTATTDLLTGQLVCRSLLPSPQ